MQGFKDFCNDYEMPDKVLFLDIDGVLQPFAQYGFACPKTEAELDILYKDLELRLGVDYRKFNLYDVTAVYYEWDLDAITELKRILNETGAKIVISSSWREGNMGDYLPDLLKIHDLRSYLFGYTPKFTSDFACIDPEFKKFKHTRSAEIYSYLKHHPFIKKWAIIDDMDLTQDFPENAVKTSFKLEEEHAKACIEILMK